MTRTWAMPRLSDLPAECFAIFQDAEDPDPGAMKRYPDPNDDTELAWNQHLWSAPAPVPDHVPGEPLGARRIGGEANPQAPSSEPFTLPPCSELTAAELQQRSSEIALNRRFVDAISAARRVLR